MELLSVVVTPYIVSRMIQTMVWMEICTNLLSIWSTLQKPKRWLAIKMLWISMLKLFPKTHPAIINQNHYSWEIATAVILLSPKWIINLSIIREFKKFSKAPIRSKPIYSTIRRDWKSFWMIPSMMKQDPKWDSKYSLNSTHQITARLI